MANKAQEHCCFVGNAIYLKFSLFHFLCQFRNATSGTITTSTNNSLRSKEYTVWVILTFWKSTRCKFSDHFFPSFPHMRVSLVPEKQKLKFYCLTTVFSFNCSNESANLKTSVKNTEEFLKEPPLGRVFTGIFFISVVSAQVRGGQWEYTVGFKFRIFIFLLLTSLAMINKWNYERL